MILMDDRFPPLDLDRLRDGPPRGAEPPCRSEGPPSAWYVALGDAIVRLGTPGGAADSPRWCLNADIPMLADGASGESPLVKIA
ncbi:hypothetical protein [Kitasatospora sp. NPDC086791]|uniref:hypothetical protein n=1 Tax=Kitasatospora sp. NPDC086791 TaxID=3155178 RepID=UPI0034294099